MEIVIAVAAKVAEYTVAPIVRPIARRCPFKNLWEYKSNLENLKTKLKNLEDKRERVQGLTNAGVEPPPDVNDWLRQTTNIINEVSRLISEDNPERGCCEGCTYSNLNECYQHRNNVARKLKDVARLFQEAMKSTNLWEYKSNLENLKKEVEKLVARRESVQLLIKDGEEPLQHVKLWQENVNKIIAEVSRLINPQQQNMQCCNGLTCSDLYICLQSRNNVARMLEGVALLLQEARDFREVSTISEETVYKSNLEKLKKDVETLRVKGESVQCLIKVGEEPLPDVKVWQDRVKKIIDEVPGLTIEHNPEHQNKVAQMLKEIAQLLQEAAQFREVSRPSIPEQTCLQPSIQPEFSESRTSILEDIITALTKADVNMVGIYGMGGVGKTTLAKKVGSQAKQDNHFHEVVFVEVSQSPDIRTIQAGIAGHLGLELEGQTESIRASKLSDYLKEEEKKEKKILIILDNLWKEIKLEEDVGIPFGNNCKGLKLLLTARSQAVLTNEMDSKHNFPVDALTDEEAWILFKSKAGARVAEFHLKTTANEIAKKCGGLPLAIVTVANALKNIEVEEQWTDALRRLNKPSPEGLAGKVYNCIKLSYDFLNEELRKIFLLCSRMGRTYDASVHDLFRYGLGLGYFDDIDTAEAALCSVSTSVDQLKAASLLLHAPEETDECSSWGRFAIHDVVCDVARSIASEDGHVFTATNGHVRWLLINEKTFKNCTSITLYNIEELSKDLESECPNIKFLCVKPKHSDLTIPDNFFIGMSSLQVLHLIEIDLKPLPSSLSRLVNLQALCLDHCELGDVVAIGDMNKLEVLSFRGSNIQMLPKQLCQLTKLRLLDLTDCSDLSVIPSKAMSSLTGIEALYMNNTSIKWKDARPGIDELKHLHRLTTLEIHIPESKMFRGLISSEPKRYNICIGDVTYAWMDRKPYSNISRRFLRLELDTKEDWIISQLPGVEELELEGEVVGAVNLLDDLARNGFPRLMYLRVSANDHCVCIVNSVSCAVLPSLESLTVRLMGSLEKICNSPLGADSFLNLKTIRVENCNKLSNIFRCLSIVGVLPNLKDLTVSYCENVEEVFAIEEQDDGNSTEVVHDIKFSQLSYLTLLNLPKLKSFCRKAKTASPLQLASYTSASQISSAKELNNHSALFNEKVATPNLQDISVDTIPQIEQIWHSLLSPLSFCVQNLTELRACRCDNLKALISSSTAISEESRGKERRDTIVFPKLHCLEMEDLTKLTGLCFGYNIEFPSLKEFNIIRCPQLKEFIFDETVVAPNLQDLSVDTIPQIEQIWPSLLSPLFSCVQNLTKLRVLRCDNLKVLFSSSTAISEESRGKERRDTIVFPKLNCLEMGDLTKLTRLCSGYNIEFPSLEEFKIQSCHQLKEFIFDETVKVPKLKELRIFDMNNLKMIWHNKCTEDSFSKLKSLEATMCHKLLTVFPSNMCGRLLSLESLNVDDCYSPVQLCDIQGINSEEYEHVPFMNLQELKVLGCPSLKYIFAKEGVAAKEVPAKFVFPKLTSLKLKHLPKLGTFYPGKHTVEGPILKRLELYDCGIHYTDEEGQTQQPLYLVQQLVFPRLEELELTGKQLTMMGQVQVPEYLFHKLKILNVLEHESTVFPFGIIQRCQNLEKLCLTEATFTYGEYQTQAGSYEGIFFCGEDQTQAAPLARMKILVLRNLRNLKYTWEQDSKLDLNFQNLKVLEVGLCISLVNLMPPSASLQNLTILNVWNCHSLETIVTFSMAKSLMKLKKMSISFCLKVTEVIQNQGDVTGRIIFSNLKTLELRGMYFLTSFCSCSFTLEFPSLEEFNVCDGWNMKTFSQGDLTMPKLQEVRINKESFRLRLDTNLNTIILQFHEKRYPRKINQSCSSSQHME